MGYWQFNMSRTLLLIAIMSSLFALSLSASAFVRNPKDDAFNLLNYDDGKMAAVENPETFEEKRAVFRMGKRAMMRFGKRAMMRFGKRSVFRLG